MASLRDIRSRISSVKSTRQITSAMKMVSAAKLKKSQNKINSLSPYVNEMNGIIEDLSEHFTEKDTSVYAEQREIKNILIVLVTSNKGLCGAFNTNICKKAINLVKEKYRDISSKNVKFLCIGKKANDFIKKTEYKVYQSHTEIFNTPDYQTLSAEAKKIMLLFENKSFDKIELVHNSFKAAGVNSMVNEVYLPFEIKKKETEFPTEYIFEPDLNRIKDIIIPDYLKIKFFSIFLDSLAAEHGARMAAMHQATDNATELIKELTLSYNKARQAEITNEILEITSGAEALKG